ncbi:MAG TPA: hypothetical protein PLF56_05955 [Micropruina sp.]|jgi:hypothetical protein|nr:hypothetical protein [Micropruina sp.]
MAIVVLCSAGHAPGVTTTALGLALAWPRPVLLVDADRTPTQSVLAGYLRGERPGHRGLGGLLQALRERRPFEGAIEAETVDLPPLLSGAQPRFLAGFPHPGVVGLFAGAWPDFVSALAAQPGDVLIDAGRVGPEGLPLPLVREADLVLVVSRTTLVSLAALRLYLPALKDAADTDRTALALIGSSMPYSRAEVQDQFGTTVAADLPHDPDAAAVLSDGLPAPRRYTGGAYFRGVTLAARSISGRLVAARELIGVRR